MISPVVLMALMYFSKEKVVTGSDQQFNVRWGTLFEEFKNNKGFLSTQFYFLFMMRRLMYGVSQVFLNSQPEMQNALNIFGTFIILGYVFRYFNFKEKGVLMCEIIGEIATMVTMVLSLIFLFNFSDKIKEVIEIVIMVVVFACILAQIAICIIMTVIGLKDKLCSNKKPVILAPSHVGKIDAGFAVDTTAVYPFNSDNSTTGKQRN